MADQPKPGEQPDGSWILDLHHDKPRYDGPRQNWTPEQLQILEPYARERGWEYAERFANLIFDQIEAIGEL